MIFNNTRIHARTERLAPDGIPRYIRCYDAGSDLWDRFTVVYTGNYRSRNGTCQYRVLSEEPLSTDGMSQWGESAYIIDRGRNLIIGKAVSFEEMPHQVREVVLTDYFGLWNLNPCFRIRDARGGIVGVFDDPDEARLSLMGHIRKMLEKSGGKLRVAYDIERNAGNHQYESIYGYQASFGSGCNPEAVEIPRFA